MIISGIHRFYMSWSSCLILRHIVGVIISPGLGGVMVVQPPYYGQLVHGQLVTGRHLHLA